MNLRAAAYVSTDMRPTLQLPPLDRRHLLGGAATAVGLAVVASCGSGSPGTGGSRGTHPRPEMGASAERGAAGLVAASAVPVGGGVSATDSQGRPLVVAQPKEGTIVAFSAICTHRGCTVAPQDGEFRCPCHGSVYALATGDNVSGPAPRPLTEVAVAVRGGQVVEA